MKSMSTQRSRQTRFLPFLSDELTEDLKLKAERELNETDENTQHGLEALKSLITNENLPVCLEDSFLLAFLRVRKYRIEEAKESLRRYVAIRRKYIKYFAHLDFSSVKIFHDRMSSGFLFYRDEGGEAIWYVHEGRLPERFDVNAVLNSLISLLHFMLEYPATSVSGFKYILDFPVARFRDFFSYAYAITTFLHLLNSIPLRLKQVDFVNANRVTRSLVKIIWPFVPAKIQQRVFVHGKDLKSFHEHFDPSILPDGFGGTSGPEDNEFFMEDYRNFYHKMKSHNVHFETQCSNQVGRRKDSLRVFQNQTEASDDSGIHKSSFDGLSKQQELSESSASSGWRNSSFELCKQQEVSPGSASSGSCKNSFGPFDQPADVPSGRRKRVFRFFKRQ